MNSKSIFPSISFSIHMNRWKVELRFFVLIFLVFVNEFCVREYQARYWNHKARHNKCLIRLLISEVFFLFIYHRRLWVTGLEIRFSLRLIVPLCFFLLLFFKVCARYSRILSEGFLIYLLSNSVEMSKYSSSLWEAEHSIKRSVRVHSELFD